jgi:hypothetical protein
VTHGPAVEPKALPILNSLIEGTDIVHKRDVNIGVAVAHEQVCSGRWSETTPSSIGLWFISRSGTITAWSMGKWELNSWGG